VLRCARFRKVSVTVRKLKPLLKDASGRLRLPKTCFFGAAAGAGEGRGLVV
jgi:hypothetical protein